MTFYTDRHTEAANAAGFLALTRFWNRCKNHDDFIKDPLLVGQTIYDEMTTEISPPVRSR
jgi:hypothetical protein